MAEAAVADRAVGDGVGLGLGRGDHVLEGLERLAGMGRHHVRRGADQQHRLEVLLGVERQVLQERVDRVGVEHEHPVAAVGRRLRRLRGADAAGRARLVLDDDGGAEPLLQAGLHHARDRIDRAARRERHDDPGDVADCARAGEANGAATAPSTSVRRVKFGHGVPLSVVPSGQPWHRMVVQIVPGFTPG